MTIDFVTEAEWRQLLFSHFLQRAPAVLFSPFFEQAALCFIEPLTPDGKVANGFIDEGGRQISRYAR